MSNAIVQSVKDHPYIYAAGAAAIVGLYVYNSGQAVQTSGSSTASLGSDAAEVQAAQQIQVAQLQANQSALVSNNQAAVANNQITGSEVIASLQSQDTLAGISAQENVQMNSDTLSAQTTQAVSLLQAQVAENQTAAQVATAQINANAYVNISNAPYQSADYIAGLQNQQLATQLTTANAQLDNLSGANTALNTQVAGLTSQVSTLTNEFNTAVVSTAPRAVGSATYNQYGPGTDYILGNGQHVVNLPTS